MEKREEKFNSLKILSVGFGIVSLGIALAVIGFLLVSR